MGRVGPDVRGSRRLPSRLAKCGVETVTDAHKRRLSGGPNVVDGSRVVNRHEGAAGRRGVSH
ncbi:hypothetical protein PCAR4_1330001 [Paraburkholderia caribensis]|nr:hypothetical protein PCAR4_1330001 [Paraburkholderia caribensis]